MATPGGVGPGPGNGQGGGGSGGGAGGRPGGPPGAPRRRALRTWLGPWAALLGGVGTLLAGVAAVLTWWQLTKGTPSPGSSGGQSTVSVPAAVSLPAPSTTAAVTATPSTAAWTGTWHGTVTQGRQKYVVVVRIRDAQLGEEFADAEYSPLGCSTVWLLTERLPTRLTGHERVTRNTTTTCVSGDFVLELRTDGTILFDWGSSRATAVLTRQ
ncbi:hypothetical protein [Kitasatospora sp. NPDC050463]|uniref:hypothetical protein n=1 Tax=Kitasatospora sp. NPDC050463 TaxID=3155786 RepID=UPI0033E7999F